MKGEIWKDIEGYEGYYQVSNMGRIKSLNYRRTGKEKILKSCIDSRGYSQIKLYKDGKKKIYLVHRLVAQAFLKNSNNLPEVNHKDEDKQNNCVENLEWCSRAYNINYGTGIKRVAEKNTNNPKLSKPVIGIDRITGLILEFPSTQEASRQTAISQGNICSCLKGKRNSAGGCVWFYADDDNE